MQSCLGIYIEDNIIKYAKLHKEKDAVKVESYNIAFYEDNLEETLKKIVSETYSYKIPISINVSGEIYNTFEISSLLNKQDTKKAIDIEYEMICNEHKYNKASMEHHYLINFPRENAEVQKVLSIIADKSKISKRISALNGYKVNTVTPITTSITNLAENDGRQNIAIVNIEEKTQITIMIDGEIYQINLLEDGMGKILENINQIENSYAKSYEVCKNMTLNTRNSSELYSETNDYMDMVTSILLRIVTQTKQIINEMFSNIDKVYITGMGTCINSIDLFFQEYITSARCEILKPYFLNNSSSQVPLKEYIEVNSAIALALDGLGMVDRNLNFIKSSKGGNGKSRLSAALKEDVSLDSIKELFGIMGETVKSDFTTGLSSSEKLLARGILSCFMIAGLFVLFSHVISNQLQTKTEEVATAITKTNAELSKLNSDIDIISARTQTYQSLIEEITSPKDETDQTAQGNQRIIQKDSIPNLLNRIMFVIPKKVKLISIKNTTADHIVIHAQAEKYEQLGYFKAVLTTNGILENVKSNSAEKSGSAIQVMIEGDLP